MRPVAPSGVEEIDALLDGGLPLGATEQYGPTVMVNILGDAWRWQGDQVVGDPNWSVILGESRAHLHLYGKGESRPGRKMGHVTRLTL